MELSPKLSSGILRLTLALPFGGLLAMAPTGCIEIRDLLSPPAENDNTIVFFNENEQGNENDNTILNANTANDNVEPNDNVQPNDNNEPPSNENDNQSEGIPPLPAGVILVPTSSGLQIAEIETGVGNFAALDATIVVNYTGWLLDTEEIFDQGEVVSFTLGGLIQGWQEGVLTMREGGKRRLIIPPDLAYGIDGRPPTIPGNATLVFDIELLQVL